MLPTRKIKRRNIQQTIRKDVLCTLLLNKHLPCNDLFNLIMNENKDCGNDERRRGWLFESLCQIIILLKCIENINYTGVYDGQLQSLKEINTVNTLLNVKVEGGGNNIADMVLKNGSTFVLFTIKYRNKYCETDVSKIENTIITQNITNDYKIGLIVKDKGVIINHTYKNGKNIDKQIHDKIIENALLFDEKDIIKGLDIFCKRFSDRDDDIEEFIDFINAEYLSSPRQILVKKLHQKMTEIKFTRSFVGVGGERERGRQNMWCIAHKPRSGKSITILLICKYLLENGCNKILIMTSVPATIKSFTDDLEKYIDFKNINFILQEDFENAVDTLFNGIVFCSVQYLKTNGKSKKKDILKKIGFDVIITDEAHQGSSTDKTKSDILEVDSDVEDLCKSIKTTIFASGTADKTRKYYKIHPSRVFEWEIEDEARMKDYENDKNSTIEYMVNRHGNVFIECLEDNTLNRDYSKHPTQVLIKHRIPITLIEEINTYNSKHGTKFGYNCSSLFALKQIVNEKGLVEYAEEFELCKDNDGMDILKAFLESIISENKMRKDTIMKQIENTQTHYNSRKSTREAPLLFIIYLPTHTGNNTIAQLQKTLKKFLEDNSLWCEYNIEYSNSLEDTGHVKEDYNTYIQTIMNKTRTENKRGCILLLGNKGSVGITYKECDATISLDDGHNLENQKQKFSRALTEANGKTIGINVDMNIQRTYLYLIDIIQKHRKNTRTTMTNAEILHYLFVHNLFLFDPHYFINNGNLTSIEIKSYYQKEAENIMKEIDDTPMLDGIECEDDMHDYINSDFRKGSLKGSNDSINDILEGEQQDCPKGDKSKVSIDAPDGDKAEVRGDEVRGDEVEAEVEVETVKQLINQTLEMCKSFLFPLLALISKSYNVFDFKDIFTNEKTCGLIRSLLKEKKIEFNDQKYMVIIKIMSNIIDNNAEIVNNIREIYTIAPAHKLRELIEKHFIPSRVEKLENAEIPTPAKLVDEILDKVPLEFWKTPQTVFEPCCGKGNFILGVFDKFYTGLEDLYPDEVDRCHIIMTKCIYYADISPLNVFITTELLKCHAQSYCGLDEYNCNFNSHVGDTLELNIKDKWDITGFKYTCGNPPFNPPKTDKTGKTCSGNVIWQKFTKKALTEWVLPGGYLSFIHPPGWRKPNTEACKFYGLYDLMCIKNQMLYLEIHGLKDGKRVFNCGTRYDWYLIEKNAHYKNSIVIDENCEKNDLDLSKFNWLPNSNITLLKKMLATSGQETCPIIYNRSNYGSDNKKHISSQESETFKYPVIHTIPLSGIRYIYSSINNKGHFGIAKVIFSDNGFNDVIIDMEGKYGMSEQSMAIKVDTLEEAVNIKMALLSNEFKNFIEKDCKLGNIRMDWRLFNQFKKDFWKEFI
jgi:hypothetical protein